MAASGADAADLGSAFYSALVEDDPEELYENAPCAYLSTLGDGTIVKANATFLRWTGYSRHEVVGRKFQELLSPGDRIFYETHFAPLLRMQGRVREIAVELECASGPRLPVLVNSVLKSGPPAGTSIIRTAIFDATERRAYERELLEAKKRAERSEIRALEIARTLQSTFLPPEEIVVPGLDVAGAYRPAGDGSLVGGDFYDVFETGAGCWSIVLGDVCGKGVPAAVVTALARYAVRTEAFRTSEASRVLERLHEALLRNFPDRFCTALMLFLRHSEKGVELTVASGGHPLPLLVRHRGRAESFGVIGTLLGMIDEADVTDASTVLRTGDVLVLYTDGVVEARRGRDIFGDQRLQETLQAAASQTAQQIAAAVVGAALDFQEGNAYDDIAVVVIKVPEPLQVGPLPPPIS